MSEPARGGSAPGQPRCSDLSRARAEPPTATAPPARGFLLVEVPGPWGTDAWTGSRLDPGIGSRVAARVSAAGVRPLLVRRPGSHVGVGAGEPRRWALVRRSRGGGGVRWSTYRRDEELLDIDPTDPPAAGERSPGVALVCTHGRVDLCCAVRGRPVTVALQAAGWEVWETTHLGGCRFAANVLALPDGELFGSLDPGSAPTVLAALRDGRLVPAYHRGRFGEPREAQAARHHVMAAVGDDRVTAVQAGTVHPLGGGVCDVDVRHGEDAYRVRLVSRREAPARLTCAGAVPVPAVVHDLVTITGPLALDGEE